tara:strand:+ start:1158 stop:2561 length:1404 start_codon:yes stop_codon:yes gene_type:complete
MLIPVMSNDYRKQKGIEYIAKDLTILNWRGEYKPGNKDFCRSIPETSEYFKQVISAFYKTEGRKWSECFTQSEELHYCWIAIDLKLDRDRPLEIYAYTGKSGAIWGRLCHSTHGTLELDRSQKILIHATKSSDESHAALTSADEFGELDGKATVPQVEQSNINAIRAVRSIKLLNRKDEDTNRIINPVLFKKMKQIERMAEQLNKKLLKLRQVWLDGNLVPTITGAQVQKAFADAAIEWYEANAHRIDTERNLTLNLPPLKDKIKLEAADAEAVEKTKHILREIKGCEIFNNDELGLKHCFKYVFNIPFLKSAERTFMYKVFELENEITLEQATKRWERCHLREAVARRSKGLSQKMKRLKYRKEVWKEMEKLKRNIKETEKAIRESIELGNTEKANGYTSGLWWLKEDLEKHRSEWKRLKGKPLENTKNVHLLSDAAETEMHVNVFYANKHLQTRGRRRNKHFVRR